MKKSKLLLSILFVFLILPNLSIAQKGTSNNLPAEIVVTSRQPGPPMWQVKNGENVLWIFPSLSLIPKGMIWESNKVAKVIAESQEVIKTPSTGVTASKLVMFNPINIVRGIRLVKRISKNPTGENLQEVIPAELYDRFAVLKSQYFPRNKKIEKYRPLVAGDKMVNIIHDKSGLTSGNSVNKTIKRLLRRNKTIKTTDVDLQIKLDGGYGTLAKRVENLMASLSKEQELGCFESQIEKMENDLEEVKYRAKAWAQGYIDEFKYISLAGDESDQCLQLIINSSENEMIEDLITQSKTLWLDAAINALETNRTTFAVRSVSDLLIKDDFIDQLKDRGYQVIEP